MNQFVPVNHFQLHYLDYPAGDPPIVLMPGMTSNAYVFGGLIQTGLSSAMRMLALNLRGRGLSGKPDSGYGTTDYAADLIGLLDALRLQQVVLVVIRLVAHWPSTWLLIILAGSENWCPSMLPPGFLLISGIMKSKGKSTCPHLCTARPGAHRLALLPP